MKQKEPIYILFANRIYKIMNTSFFYKVLEAVETNLTVGEVLDGMVDINEFKNYKIRLIHNNGESEFIIVGNWEDKHDLKRINPMWSDGKAGNV